MIFIFNNNQSDDLGIIITSSNHLDRFKKRREFIQVPGRTGDLVLDDGSYENLELEITCVIEDEDNIDERLDHIEDWLKTNDYSLLEFDDGVRFSAIYMEMKEMRKIIKNVVECKIVFSCKKEVD